MPGDVQRAVLEIVAPIQVESGDIRSQEEADAAIDSIIFPDFAVKADASRVG